MFITEISDKVYDFIIVGSGPAGVAIATKLAKQTDARILIVESGGKSPNNKIHKLSHINATGDLPADYFPLHAQRILGGTSAVWSGFCTTLEKRSFLNNEWPITFGEIEPFYKEAAHFLSLPDDVYQRPVTKIENSNLVYRPYHLSPPTRLNSEYLSYFRRSRQVDVLLNQTCLTVLSDGDTVLGLKLTSSVQNQNRHEQIVTAKTYILACGGIGNPRLLLNSKLAQGSPVGKYFMEHPHIYQAGTLALNKAEVDKIIASGTTSQQNIVHAFQLADEFSLSNQILSFTVSFDLRKMELQPFFGKNTQIYSTKAVIRAEMRAMDSNELSLSADLDQLNQRKATLKFKFEFDQLAQKSWNLFAVELLRSGLGRATTPPEKYDEITGGGHYIGTTRMGLTAEDSVVDKNCKVHQQNNLYLAGSSIFSASGAANPTLSIVSFAYRLADYLTEQHNRS